ncbi:hypothetical protein [Patulibacter americanus]|uniref:hypothetical protein n=1 Tax=Patulibacter americanus TaxID=588672 RepID=UPI0003B3D38F|nr:hypothetical protein [Patulibacter americanus]
MARRAAAVLARTSPARLRAVAGVLLALGVLTVLARSLPELQPPARASLVAAVPPLALLGALTYALGPLVRSPVGLGVLAGVGLVLTAAAAAAGAHGTGTVPEALLGIALGLVFARVFDLGAFVLGLPVVVGVVDAWTTLASGAARSWPQPLSGGDPLLLELPSWSAETAAGQVTIATVLFLAALQGYAVRERLRPAGAALGMTAGLLLAYLLEWRTDRAMPATAFVAAGFLLAELDALPRWWRAGGLEGRGAGRRDG